MMALDFGFWGGGLDVRLLIFRGRLRIQLNQWSGTIVAWGSILDLSRFKTHGGVLGVITDFFGGSSLRFTDVVHVRWMFLDPTVE